jgi:hypothetical protein
LPPDSGNFSATINHQAPTYTAEVNELLQLLGLPAPKDHSSALVLPVSLALDGRDSGGIGMTTRSVYHLVAILSAASSQLDLTSKPAPPGAIKL